MSRRFRALVTHPHVEALGELAEMLGGVGLVVETARSTVEALNKLRSQPAHVIVAFQVSSTSNPFDGVGFLEASVGHAPDALRIALVSSPDEAVELDYRPAQSGTIIRLVAKPSERSRLVALVGEGMKLMNLVEEQRDLVRKLSIDQSKLQRRETLLDVVVKERTKELEESYEKLKIANRQALFGLAEAIEAKDPYTKGHCGRVAAYSLVLAKEAGYPTDGLETLEFGAFLHDIGKIGIRDAVLLKPGPLDDNEWTHMREHPVKGYDIASKIEMLHPIMPAVRNHHERWDGSGYPDKMRAEDIPLAARIVAIADAYDAMATDRPYKKALPLEECEAILSKTAGKMYDPELIQVFVTRRLGALYRDDYDALPFDDGHAALP
ncbi:MAG: HD-GYP domain-containing protein [Deltaproteobacteria bacterium]|nr:HD-GYP domain-containing protein [Deltaproteobacteria bacterium]MCW5806456.1 HD-GYP domain-containing protein [Deltaproteobacteria bacterium]